MVQTIHADALAALVVLKQWERCHQPGDSSSDRPLAFSFKKLRLLAESVEQNMSATSPVNGFNVTPLQELVDHLVERGLLVSTHNNNEEHPMYRFNDPKAECLALCRENLDLQIEEDPRRRPIIQRVADFLQLANVFFAPRVLVVWSPFPEPNKMLISKRLLEIEKIIPVRQVTDSTNSTMMIEHTRCDGQTKRAFGFDSCAQLLDAVLIVESVALSAFPCVSD